MEREAKSHSKEAQGDYSPYYEANATIRTIKAIKRFVKKETRNESTAASIASWRINKAKKQLNKAAIQTLKHELTYLPLGNKGEGALLHLDRMNIKVSADKDYGVNLWRQYIWDVVHLSDGCRYVLMLCITIDKNIRKDIYATSISATLLSMDLEFIADTWPTNHAVQYFHGKDKAKSIADGLASVSTWIDRKAQLGWMGRRLDAGIADHFRVLDTCIETMLHRWWNVIEKDAFLQ